MIDLGGVKYRADGRPVVGPATVQVLKFNHTLPCICKMCGLDRLTVTLYLYTRSKWVHRPEPKTEAEAIKLRTRGWVPWWHPVLASVLLAATAVLIVRAVAGMFRAQALVSGQSIKFMTYFQALIGRI